MPGLGKGLSSLIPDNVKRKTGSVAAVVPPLDQALSSVTARPALEPSGDFIAQIPLEKIKSNRFQPRQAFHHGHIEELAQSIKEHGMLQPLILTPDGDGYEMIAGERRLRAAKVLGLKTVPAIVREAKSQQKLELALVENIQRQELNMIEEAAAYQRLIDEFSLSHEDVSKRVGRSRSVITNAVRLLNLPELIQKAVIEGKISSSHARAIAALADEKDQLDLFDRIVNEKLNVREVEEQAKKVVVQKHLREVRFDPVLNDMIEHLRGALGTKVAIKKKGAKGTILISFFSEEELSEIVGKISEL